MTLSGCDTDEMTVVAGITKWMAINRECIFGTRPWKVFGEGPASQGPPLRAQGFNEGKGKPVTAEHNAPLRQPEHP